MNIQRSFGKDLLFEVGYVGTKGTKLPRFIEGNPAIYVPGVDPITRQPFPRQATPINGGFIPAVPWPIRPAVAFIPLPA